MHRQNLQRIIHANILLISIFVLSTHLLTISHAAVLQVDVLHLSFHGLAECNPSAPCHSFSANSVKLITIFSSCFPQREKLLTHFKKTVRNEYSTLQVRIPNQALPL